MKAALWLTTAHLFSLTLLPALGCKRDKNDDTRQGEAEGEGSDAFLLQADELADLPYVTAGQDPEPGVFEIREVGGGGSGGKVSFEVSGAFEISGDTGPLSSYEARSFEVSYTGDPDAPAIEMGAVTVTVDGQSVDVALVAVVGDPLLRDAVWEEDTWGARTVVTLPSAPFPYEDAPYTDGSVLIFVPEGLSDQGEVGVVTHIHGHNATLSEVVSAQLLVEQHALSGRDAILVVPQGPVEAASGDFGRLMEPGAHATLIRDALSVLYRDGLVLRPQAGAQVISAHSGGYLCTAAILDDRGAEIQGVHLFDALYAKAGTYKDYVRGGGLLRSVYTSTGGTDDDNQDLAADLAAEGYTVSASFDDDSLATSDLSIGPSSSTHSGCLYESRAYARWLAQSGLPRSPFAPPELLSVVSDGAQATVTWRNDRAPSSPTILVEGSTDGVTWASLTQVDDAAGAGVSAGTVEARPWIRVRQLSPELGTSAPSDVYGGTGSSWLVVDGFDRVLDGSYRSPTHDFAARVGVGLGQPFSVASNEAVIRGDVLLSDYAGVIWLLGDESSADTTLDATERSLIAAHLAAGGKLIISGAELGYATDPTWLAENLHAAYVSDDAGSVVAGAYTFGVTYEEDYPDVLSGEETIWSYDTGGAAAVIHARRVITVGFALETMDDATLALALPELLSWLTG